MSEKPIEPGCTALIVAPPEHCEMPYRPYIGTFVKVASFAGTHRNTHTKEFWPYWNVTLHDGRPALAGEPILQRIDPDSSERHNWEQYTPKKERVHENA